MRVLHLDTEGGYGGSSRSLQITVNKLVLEGGMSEVWHAKDGPSNKILHEKGINTKINRNIVSIVPLPNNNLKNFFLLFFKLIKLFKLATEVMENKADILHLNYNGLLPLCFLLRKKGYKKKIIVHTRTIIPNNFYGRMFIKLYKYADATVIISSVEKKQMIKVDKKILQNIPYKVINNCAPDFLFSNKINKYNEKKIKVVFLGTIDYVRAPDRVVQLARITKKMNLPIYYYIFGNEGRKSLFRKKKIVNYQTIIEDIKKFKLEKNVFFKGFTDNPEKELVNADILIRPSRKGDCWGRDIIEAMAAGLLVVATGKKKIFIRNKFNGLMFSDWEPKKIALSIKFYLDNNKLLLKLKKQARTYAQENFNAKNYAKNFSDFLEEIYKRN